MWIATIIYIFLVIIGIKHCLWSEKEFRKFNPKLMLIMLMLCAFGLRIFLAIYSVGHPVDLACFDFWANRITEVGAHDFYALDTFSDYPPGYMIILWGVGLIKEFFQIVSKTPMNNLLLKLPAILFDLVTSYFLIRIARKRFGFKLAFVLGAAYLFAPAVLVNSSVWGQVDAVFTFFLLLVCYYLMQGKCEYTYIPFMIGVLIKPQMLMFAPVLLLGMIEHVFIKDFSWKKTGRNAWLGICSLMGSALFLSLFDAPTVLAQYQDTMTSYPYATVNAYNFWAMIGQNWGSQDQLFLGTPYSTWGYAGIIGGFLLTAFIWIYQIRHKKENNYFFLAAIFLFTVFTFSVRMHERYLFPFIILLLFAYVYTKNKNFLIFDLLISLIHHLNVIYVYYTFDINDYNPKDFGVISFSIFTVSLYLIFIIFMIKELKKEKLSEKVLIADVEDNVLNISEEDNEKSKIEEIEPDVMNRKMNRKDWTIVAIVTFIYMIIAFFRLGDMEVPSSGNNVPVNEGIYINMPEMEDEVTLQYYLGNLENRKLNLYIWDAEQDDWIFSQEITMVSVFRWEETEISQSCQYLCLMVTDPTANILEIGVRNSNGELLDVTVSENSRYLIDEQGLVPEYRSYLNGTIFDEIYHARTGYELIHNLQTYEWTHPPLGKIFISMGIRIFGMDPFGWRFAGTVFGILMLPLFYIFSKRMFLRTWVAMLTTILVASDFMHFTQTRIATIDVFVVFFIIAMYYYMYRYFAETHTDKNLRSMWKILAFCGLFMGLAISCKWTGAYAAIGIAIIFFLALFKKDYKTKRFMKTIAVCFLFFIATPFIIYTLSYLPIIRYDGVGLLGTMWKDQSAMFFYHQGVHASHPYSSMFYQWPAVYRPILYYIRAVGENLSESICAFGNPLIWWSGIPAFFYLVYSTIKKKNETALFLVVGYLAQYVPWMFVNRTLFIYHYFPSVPFVILMIGYVMTDVVKKNKKTKKWCYIYVAVAVLLFIFFYPVLSGYPVNKEYVARWLRWFDSWVISI